VARTRAPRPDRSSVCEVNEMSNYTVLLPLIVLGAFHGLNPGMGWLFAVMRGLQEQRRAAVVRALGPIALGHAASVGLVVALVALARDWIDLGALEVFAARSEERRVGQGG